MSKDQPIVVSLTANSLHNKIDCLKMWEELDMTVLSIII